MKRLALLLAPLGLLLACPAVAADGKDRPDFRGPRNPERMQKLLDKFDTDGDGKLDQEERKAAREARGDRDRPRGERDGRRGDPRERGPEAKGPRGPGRNGPPRDFDRGPGRRGPSEEFGRRRGRGAPPEKFDRGPRDRGPREDVDSGRRRGGPPERSQRGPGRRGPGQDFDRSRASQGPPRPEVMFDRMDEDGDGQLSKAEFMDMARRMRRMGPGGPPPRQLQRDDDSPRDRPARGEFRGGPRRGPGFDRPRPDFEDRD